MVPACLAQASSTPAPTRVTAEGTGPARESDPLASGSETTGTSSFSVRRRPGAKRAGGARRCCFCSHGELPYRRKETTATGYSSPLPNTAQRQPSNFWSDRVYAHWRSRGCGEHKRRTKSTARIMKEITSDANWERSHHKPGTNLLTRGWRATPGSCRRKGWRWREWISQGRRGRRGRGSSTRALRASIADNESGTDLRGL